MSSLQQERAIAGAKGKPLSKEQKKNVCMLASTAWKRNGEVFHDMETPPELRLTKSQALELWRQEEQIKSVGKKHLTKCAQSDYPVLMSHFAELAGDERAVKFWNDRKPSDDHRRALRVLNNEIKAANHDLGNAYAYARAIAKAKCKGVEFEKMSAKQLWMLVFDVRRAAAKKRKAKHDALEEAPF